MTTVTSIAEGRHAGAFIFSEANGHRSRENITVVSGANLVAGTVVGVITASGKYTFFDNDASDGTQTAAGVLLADCDATSADKAAAIIARDAEVLGEELFWHANNDASDKAAGITELATLGIIVR